MMQVKNIESQKDKVFSLTYGGFLYPLIVIQCVWIGAGAMSMDPAIAAHFASFNSLIYTPLLAVLFCGAALFSYEFRDLLSDYFSQFNYNEKFAYFLINLLFFFMPLFIIRRPSATLSFLSLNFFILFTMYNERSLARIYASNLFIIVLLISKQPALSIFWVIVSYLLVTCTMCFDYFYFRSRKYDVRRYLPIGEFAMIGIRYVLPSLLAGVLLFWALPPIHPRITKNESIGFMPSSGREIQVRPDISTRMVLTAALTALILMFTLALLNWLHKKYRSKNPPPAIELKGLMRRVRNFVDEKIFHPRRPRPSSPRDRIINDYNRFCEEMARMGQERFASQTPHEYASIIMPALFDKGPIVNNITYAFEQAMYRGAKIIPEDAETFTWEVDRILALLKEIN